jgi:hypothetical protein
MTSLPVRCETCGLEWADSSAIEVSGTATGITMVGSRVGPCPRCGGWGRIRDGVYDFVDGAISAIRAVDPTRLVPVRDVLRQAKDERITPEQAAEQIVVSVPELESLVRAMQSWRDPKWWIMALLAVLAVVIPLLTQHDGSLSADEQRALERGVRQAIEQAGGPQSPASPRSGVTVRNPPRGTAVKARRKRPGKTYGQRKKRKRP